MQVPIRKPGKFTHHKPDRHITEKKLREFEVELDKLKRVSQPRAILEVKRLAELGDFSENAEYQIAKGRLRGINERMLQLEDAVKQAIVIPSGSQTDQVRLGNRVTIKLAGEQKSYLLLGPAETDPDKGIISHTSPLGAALIGKKVGETFTITLAEKEVECTVLHIE